MNTPLSRPTIKELALEDSEEVKLHLELIRIIEKDIDELRSGDTKNGWTSWAIIGAIAGALLLFFGETRKLKTFPTEAVEITVLAGLFLYQIATTSLRIVNFAIPGIKPGRVRWSRDENFTYLPSRIYSLLVLLASLFVAITLSLPTWTKAVLVTTLILWTLNLLLMIVFAIKNRPLGFNRRIRKFGLINLLILLPTSTLTLILLLTRMQFPLGEDLTLPYVLAGLLFALLLLISHLISATIPSRLLSNLHDLRNDIIFLRVDIDEALRRYEVLTEGETLPDALKKELGEVLSDIDFVEYTQSNMKALIEKLNNELPLPNDAPEIREQKLLQLKLDKDSFYLHSVKCGEVLTILGEKLKNMNIKISEVNAVSEDYVSENQIRSLLTQRLQIIEATQAQLRQRLQSIDYYIANPDQIPLPSANQGGDNSKPSGE